MLFRAERHGVKYVHKSIITTSIYLIVDVLKEGRLAHDLPGPFPIFSPFPSLSVTDSEASTRAVPANRGLHARGH